MTGGSDRLRVSLVALTVFCMLDVHSICPTTNKQPLMMMMTTSVLAFEVDLPVAVCVEDVDDSLYEGILLELR